MSFSKFSALTFSAAVIGVMLACCMSHDNTQVNAAPADAPSQVGSDAAVDPVVVVDRARARTADTDADQLETGTFSISASSSMTTKVKVADGPFVLTDFAVKANQSTWTLSLFVSSGPECSPYTGGAGALSQSFSANESDHGTKLFAKAGQFLCVSLTDFGDSAFGTVTWAGFHPYTAP